MILHCTQKLATKLPQISATPLAEISPLGSWHAHLYTIDRRQCVLFCHDESRYILFYPGLRKEQFADLGSLLRQLFLGTLALKGVTEAKLKRIEMVLGPVGYDRATDRSVLGTLNVTRMDLDGSLVQVANVLELDPLAVSLYLNKRPMTVRGRWLWPVDEMLTRIEQLKGTVTG
jgi:hypothetical protein